MKRVGTGTVGAGFVALGWALSVGIVSIGTNAVGWIAIGVNAAGFVSVGLVNSVGVFSFGGVNALGGWGSGGVNAGGAPWLGLLVSATAAVGLLVARVRVWPREEPHPLASLPEALEGAKSPARAWIERLGEDIVLRAGATEVRAKASADVTARCAALGRGARVLVRFARIKQEVATAGYRDDAAVMVTELIEVTPDPRPSLARAIVSGPVGLNLVFAWAGLVVAVVAFFVWR
jgi:hypothetical protein